MFSMSMRGILVYQRLMQVSLENERPTPRLWYFQQEHHDLINHQVWDLGLMMVEDDSGATYSQTNPIKIPSIPNVWFTLYGKSPFLIGNVNQLCMGHVQLLCSTTRGYFFFILLHNTNYSPVAVTSPSASSFFSASLQWRGRGGVLLGGGCANLGMGQFRSQSQKTKWTLCE